MYRYASPSPSRLKHHLVHQTPNPIDLDLYYITALQEARPLRLEKDAHATRRARHDGRPGPQRRPSRQMRNDLLDGPNHVIGARLLPHLAIDLGAVRELLRIGNPRRADDARPEGRKAIEGLCVSVLAARHAVGDLEVARRHVVAGRVAQHVVESGCFGDVLARLANDDRQLAFVVELRAGVGGDGNGVERPGEGVAGLGEDDGVGGDLELWGGEEWLALALYLFGEWGFREGCLWWVFEEKV